MDIPAQGERNFARNSEENDKKFFVEPCRVGEREKVLKSFEKMFEQVKFEFLNKIIYDFRLIENQFRLIETVRSSHKILKEILIDQKIDWIN